MHFYCFQCIATTYILAETSTASIETMSHLQYYSYKGVGERNREKYHYSQAVRVGDRIECAGQGGWDPATGEVPKDINEQIDQAFANVDLNLKDAGGKGWSQVFRVTSYTVQINDESVEALVRSYKKWMPDHQPISTAVGVPRLAEEGMKFEIEVVAHDPEGATKTGP